MTVSLSGDGGDELFGGYDRYSFVSRLWRRLHKVPGILRHLGGRGIRAVPPKVWDDVFSLAERVLPDRMIPALPAQKMQKAASILGARSVLELHTAVSAQWTRPELILDDDFKAATENLPAGHAILPNIAVDDRARQMFWDMRTYLVDDILTKVDRASMHVGLEARVPFLDHRFVEFTWRIPLEMKFNGGAGKVILKRFLGKHLPANLVNRPKMGFSVPIDSWLRGPLREWADHYLDPNRLRSGGILCSRTVHDTWVKHLSGRVNRGTALWTVLMFETWKERIRSWDC